MRRSKKENKTKHIVNKRGENADENRRITERKKSGQKLKYKKRNKDYAKKTKRTGTKQKKTRKGGGEN